MAKDVDPATSAALPRITIPPSVPPTPEEIERRRELFARMMARRDAIGPIGIAADELIHEVGAEMDGDDHPPLQGDGAMPGDSNHGTTTTLKRITFPSIPRPTPEELERRKEAVDRILALRDKIGPIGISTSDLIREVRDEADGIDE